MHYSEIPCHNSLRILNLIAVRSLSDLYLKSTDYFLTMDLTRLDHLGILSPSGSKLTICLVILCLGT